MIYIKQNTSIQNNSQCKITQSSVKSLAKAQTCSGSWQQDTLQCSFKSQKSELRDEIKSKYLSARVYGTCIQGSLNLASCHASFSHAHHNGMCGRRQHDCDLRQLKLHENMLDSSTKKYPLENIIHE